MKKIAVIHTFLYSVEDIKTQFRKYIPEVEMINIIDDSLLQEALRNKGLTPNIIKRYCNYAQMAESLGVDAILNQCSSVGEAADIAAKMISIPIYKIDEPMAREAVQIGKRVAVIATAISTVAPSCRLVETVAAKMGKEVKVTPCFADGAYDALLRENDREKHNVIIIDTIKKAAEENDVIILAQGSMYHLIPLLKDIPIPVLTSLESGIKQMKEI